MPGAPATADTLLSVERVRVFAGTRQADWVTYLATSTDLRATDSAKVQDELRSIGKTAWWPAPAGAEFRLGAGMVGAWFATAEADRLASAIGSFQTPSGGWSKAVDYARPRETGQSFASQASWSWIATFDNAATTEQLRLIGGVAQARGDSLHKAAFVRGLAYIATSQFPNGCWPQIYPLEGGYHDAATYNDHATVRVLRLLLAVGAGEYGFVAAAERARASAEFQRGVACMIATQVVVAGTRTAWGQQHDPLTLVPVKGRSYEPAALCSLESAAIVDLLMELPAPDATTVAAVRAGMTWLAARAIHGYAYDASGVLIARAGAGPLWARFYEIGTNRPIFSDRDGVVRYNLSEVGQERRSGYAWYVTTPAATLARYEAWKQIHAARRARS